MRYSFLPRCLSCSVFMSAVCLSLAHSCSTHTQNLVSINLLNQSSDCRLRYYLFSGETEWVEEKKWRLCTSSFQSVQWTGLWVYTVLLPRHKCKKGDADPERRKRLEKGAKVWLSCQTTGRVQEIACFYLLRQNSNTLSLFFFIIVFLLKWMSGMRASHPINGRPVVEIPALSTEPQILYCFACILVWMIICRWHFAW